MSDDSSTPHMYISVVGLLLVLGSVSATCAALFLRCGNSSKQNDVVINSSEHKTMLSSNGVIELDILSDKLYNSFEHENG